MADAESDDEHAEYPTVHEHRVRFADVDREEVVFYGRYLTYADEAFNAYLRAIGSDYDAIRDDGWGIRVVETSLEYHAPARAGDRLAGALRVDAVGNTSFTTRCRLRRIDDGTLLAEGETTRVAVDDSGDSTVRVPDQFREAVVEFQDDPPSPV